MPKVIVRRDGKELQSTFVAAWEPFGQAPWLGRTRMVDGIPADDGIGVQLEPGDESATVLYRKPGRVATLAAPGLTANAAFTVLRLSKETARLDLNNGTAASFGDVAVQVRPWADAPVEEQGVTDGVHWMRIKTFPAGYPADVVRQPHAGGQVRFAQEGQASWWLPVARIEREKSGARVVFSGEIGFRYDVKAGILTETCFPFRLMHGRAVLQFPANCSLARKPGTIMVSSDADVELRLKGALAGARPRLRTGGGEFKNAAFAFVVSFFLGDLVRTCLRLSRATASPRTG